MKIKIRHTYTRTSHPIQSHEKSQTQSVESEISSVTEKTNCSVEATNSSKVKIPSTLHSVPEIITSSHGARYLEIGNQGIKKPATDVRHPKILRADDEI
jgi:hypothetical protein